MVYMGGEPMTREIAEDPRFQTAMWVSLVLYLPLSLLFWHAPGLVHWHGVPPVKSLFFSIVACVRNMGAFTLFGLGWLGVFLLGGVLISLVASLFAALGLLGAGAAPGLVGSLMVGMALVMAGMFFSSVVFTFRDCFEPPENPLSKTASAALAPPESAL